MWESTNLVDWTGERLVTLEDETAGMVWAPEAIWDPSKGIVNRAAGGAVDEYQTDIVLHRSILHTLGF